MVALVAAALVAISSAALPPPPNSVELPTRMFGTVALHHAHHLAMRIACKSCHGAGRITKVGPLGALEGHARCYSCHVERGAGPTDCRGCHQGVPAKSRSMPPVPPDPGGWRSLRWCMTTAQVHAALSRMSVAGSGQFMPVESPFARLSTREYDVAVQEPISPIASTAQARLQFKSNALASVKLYLTANDMRATYDELLAGFVTEYGPPTIADPPWELWWILDDTSMLLLPAIPEVAPVEIWFVDRAATCPRPTDVAELR